MVQQTYSTVNNYIFPLVHKYKCALQNLKIVDPEVEKCREWAQKFNVREKCLEEYERTNRMGFIPNFGSNLIEYYYGSLGPKTMPKRPFIADSNITISQI